MRTVPVPAFLMNQISDLVDGRGPTTLSGRTRRRIPAAAAVRARVVAAGRDRAELPRITPHDLRHTAASLSVSAGANVKALQRMLGHVSAAMTLDTYSDLFDDDLDSVADALDAAVVKLGIARLAETRLGTDWANRPKYTVDLRFWCGFKSPRALFEHQGQPLISSQRVSTRVTQGSADGQTEGLPEGLG